MQAGIHIPVARSDAAAARNPVLTVSAATRQGWQGRFFLFLLLLLLAKQATVLWAVGLDFSAPALLPMLGAELLLFAPTLLAPGRRRALVCAYLLASLLCAVDAIYYPVTAEFISVPLFRAVGEGFTAARVVAASLKAGDWRLVGDLPLVVLLALRIPRAPASRPSTRLAWASVSVALGVLLSLSVGQLRPGLAGISWTRSSSVTAIGLLPYHLACLARRLETVLQGESAHREVKRDLRAWVEDRSWRLGATSTASASGASIVIVMVESLQEFVLDLRVDGQEITPFLNRFARSSDLFESAYAQTGNGHTSDAEFSALCSSPAAGEGAVVLDYAENHFRCIGHLAAEHGYATVAAHGNDLSFFHRRTVYPRLGFQSLLDGSIAPEAPSVGFGRLDVPFLQAVAGKLAATRRPYLAHVVTVSSHWPYEVPDAPLPLPSIQNAPLASYLGAIHYADRALGAFYEAVRASGQPEPIFVLFGDHGAFGRNSAAAQEINASQDPDNELAWTDFERRVPLLIHLPGQTAGSVHREVAGQIDLAPTIAALLGFGPPKALWIGRDLFGGRPGALAFHDQSALDDRRLFVSAAAEEPSERCYDRTTSGPLPLADCDGLRALGRRDFESWDKVLQYDLATSLVR